MENKDIKNTINTLSGIDWKKAFSKENIRKIKMENKCIWVLDYKDRECYNFNTSCCDTHMMIKPEDDIPDECPVCFKQIELKK